MELETVVQEEPQTEGLIQRMKGDWAWLVLLALLAAVPFRDGFIHGEIVGAGPDVISTLWGMWWLQQEGARLLDWALLVSRVRSAYAQHRVDTNPP